MAYRLRAAARTAVPVRSSSRTTWVPTVPVAPVTRMLICVSMLADESFLVLDDALIRLRRLWAMPATAGSTSERDASVQMSTVLVVDAIDRLGPVVEVSLVAVAERLDVAPSTASRLVDRAVTARMVRRRISAGDPAGRRSL